jgi:hypothetical protein
VLGSSGALRRTSNPGSSMMSGVRCAWATTQVQMGATFPRARFAAYQPVHSV